MTATVKMMTWLLLLPLLWRSSHGEENVSGVLDCGPQNLALNSSAQKLLLTWEDDPSCSALRDPLTYELTVLIADQEEHHDEVTVTPERIGSTHSWSWTSRFPLECATHSVRLTSRYNNHTRPRSQERTLSGITSPKIRVYPQDRYFEVGSVATFCCFVPDGQSFEKMYLSGYRSINTSIMEIRNQTYALSFSFHREEILDVKCKTNLGGYGATTFFVYPPKDLRCETQDMESVVCHWTVGTVKPWNPTEYQLLGRKCSGSDGRCLQKTEVKAGEQNWTLTVQNKVGKLELRDRADLTKRVHMFAPDGVTASDVNPRNVRLQWSWTVPKYNHLNLTCQLDVSDGDGNTTTEDFGVGLKVALLDNLIPNWNYKVKLRCGTAQYFWKWGDWSDSIDFHTEGDVPDALDVWMQKKKSQIEIIWTMPLANQSHGNITDFEVTWAKTGERDQPNVTKVPHTKRSLTLSLDTREELVVTVTARNIYGSSSPSSIIAPSVSSEKTRVNTSWIDGTNGGFDLWWAESPAASCGYIVDWRPAAASGVVEWLKLPSNQTGARITSENFQDGRRYWLSVYACTQGAPVLLEEREGYARETRIEEKLFKQLKFKELDSDAEISWDPLPLRTLTASIRGYILSYRDDGKDFNVSTDRPEATSLRAPNLQAQTLTFTVTARTGLGECCSEGITATLRSQNNLMKSMFISLGIAFVLLSFFTIFCYRHWEHIKEKVYPPIPKPVLVAPAVHSFTSFHTDHSEEKMDIPQLLYKSEPLVTDYISPRMHVAQNPCYYNDPLGKRTPPPLHVRTVPSHSGLPSSPFRGTFPNPTYNLMVQRADQRPGSETLRVGSSGGYLPQRRSETFSLTQADEDPENTITCVSSYISLPQLSST
ncbi:leukemia inhibitory factor receptor-like isoform 1-T2 [Odontesthes bonariensis]|uniref:leukemia inhibitory factor receptor-like n=1 Tax=Odontesthes bonariensis TaxID=219752 RepID=UPI003F58400A